MQRITARVPPGGQAGGTERGAAPDPHEGHEGGESCLHPCQRTDRQEGLGCLCRGHQSRRMDSLLGAEPRETWAQSLRGFVSFPPHRVLEGGLPLCCAGFSPCRARAAGSAGFGTEARGPSSGEARGLAAPAACGVFTDQTRALCPLHWQVASQPLGDQGSPLGGAFNLTPSKEGAPWVAQGVKNPPAMWETQVRSLDQEDPLEEDITTHSRILAWRIPWTEKAGGLYSTGLQRVTHNWAMNTSNTFHLMEP